MERRGASPHELDGDEADGAKTGSEKGLWRRHVTRLRYRGKFEGREVRVKDFVLPIVEMARYVGP